MNTYQRVCDSTAYWQLGLSRKKIS